MYVGYQTKKNALPVMHCNTRYILEKIRRNWLDYCLNSVKFRYGRGITGNAFFFGLVTNMYIRYHGKPLSAYSNVLKDLKGGVRSGPVRSGPVWSGRPYLLSSHLGLLV